MFFPFYLFICLESVLFTLVPHSYTVLSLLSAVLFFFPLLLASCNMHLSKGQFVKGQLLDGRFLTVAPLNHGSFGMVFLAEDTNTGQDVAVKCMAKSDNSTHTDERFEELDSHLRLGYHPHIVNLIHSFETEDRLYLVLEYCANGDLYEAIRLNRGPLETCHVRDFMLQLISAVEFMHASDLYHRDIKPENIFLTQDGSMKLGDFGLATRDKWCQEACVGSDRYMAPEQYEPVGGAGYCAAKADIWAIGICLLNVLFGRNPFSKPVESDVIFADYARDRQSIFDVFPNMSQDTYEILTHALAFDPEKRSLSGLRDAIIRAVSFTTDEDALDDFCTEDRTVIPASANREPLRTPSIQSPSCNVNSNNNSQAEYFPWAEALQKSTPQLAVRQLSPTATDGSDNYSEELFPASEVGITAASWFSSSDQTATPSKDSFLGSALGESYKSSSFGFPTTVTATASRRFQAYPPPSDPVPITGSLPGNAFKSLPSLSIVFGKNNRNGNNNNSDEQISKSWSDLWDEEEESENEELQRRRMQNSRSWSQESSNKSPVSPVSNNGNDKEETSSSFVLEQRLSTSGPSSSAASTPLGGGTRTPTANNTTNSRTVAAAAAPVTAEKKLSSLSRSVPKNSSSSSSSLDKWAALGDRRRNYKPASAAGGVNYQCPTRTTTTNDGGGSGGGLNWCCWRKDWGLGSSGFDYGSWVRKTAASPSRYSRAILHDKGRIMDRGGGVGGNNWRHEPSSSLLVDYKQQPKVNNNNNNNNNKNNASTTAAAAGYDGSVDEDLDLVGGGWHDLHL